MEEKKWKNKNFYCALKKSISGIKYVFKNERNFKIQLIFAVLVIVFSIIFKISIIKLTIFILCIGFVLFAEFLNTVIENMMDLYTQEYNEKVKNIKDIASGMVLITAITSAIIGTIIFSTELLEKII